MILYLALLAAFGCALCNGIAAVLQKVSADKEKITFSLNVKFLFRLLKDWPYLVGIILDILAWVFTLIAVHNLPLFVVQPIIAFSVVITAIVERFIFHKKFTTTIICAIALTIAGLSLLATTAAPETSVNVRGLVQTIIILGPILFGIIGVIFVKKKDQSATIVLAAIAGLSFGGTTVTGRMLKFSQPYWHTFFSFLFVALVAYGIIGLLLFTMALQRNLATIVSAVMITFETVVPIIIGLLFLGDTPKHNLWTVMVIGACIALSGTLLIAAKGLYPTSNRTAND
ncbi:MAG TPA: DMT family transporter [Patescibacteria group bacterium]|nr:DMT family transporter [Patescibacteria group bacterium]